MPFPRAAKIIVGVVVTVALVFAAGRYSTQIRHNVAQRDSLAYWAAGSLLLHGADPYNHDAVFALEKQHGYAHDRPLVLRTPPWSLFMVLPLGLMNPFSAWVCWLALLFFCLVVGLRLCRSLYGNPGMPPNWLTLLAYLFAPVPACLVSGQMGLVLMLGVVLFLYLEHERPFVAGMALLLPFTKPHLLSIFWVVLLIFVLGRRKRRLAWGFITALVAATSVALAFDPHVFLHYRQMLQEAGIGEEFIPALSGVLRLLFFRRHFWVQFIPVAVATGWSIWYMRKHWQEWDWKQHGPALLVVAMFTSPYEWLSDEAILLPAVLQGLAFVFTAQHIFRARTKIALFVFALLDLLLLLILRSKVPFSTGIYFWSTLVWFGWYFYALRLNGRAHQSRAAESALGCTTH